MLIGAREQLRLHSFVSDEINGTFIYIEQLLMITNNTRPAGIYLFKRRLTN